MTPGTPAPEAHHGFTNAIVRVFLNSNLSLILILIAVAVGAAALILTPREEDPQIVVPMADVYVNFPGHSAAEVEQLVATPLEKLLYQIDGVEHVYSMSRPDQAIITVRYYVGQDRERSLVKLYKRIDEHLDIVPPGVTGWIVKPVEIDDVPIVTLTLTSSSADQYALRRVGEEVAQRLAAVKDISRAYVVGGQPRAAMVYLDPERMQAYQLAPLQVQRALEAANVTQTSGDFTRDDTLFRVEAGRAFDRPGQLNGLVVGVSGDLSEGRRCRSGRPGGDNKLRALWLGAGARVCRACGLDRYGCRPIHGNVGGRRRVERVAAGGDDCASQEEGHERGLGRGSHSEGSRSTQGPRNPRQHEPGRHAQLRADGGRQGERTGRSAGGRDRDCRGAAHPESGLARGADCGRGGAGRVRADARGEHARGLHDQPGDAVRADFVARLAGR
jgi:hypothetical protein